MTLVLSSLSYTQAECNTHRFYVVMYSTIVTSESINQMFLFLYLIRVKRKGPPIRPCVCPHCPYYPTVHSAALYTAGPILFLPRSLLILLCSGPLLLLASLIISPLLPFPFSFPFCRCLMIYYCQGGEGRKRGRGWKGRRRL